MLSTFWGVVRDGKVQPLEGEGLPEGASVLVTVLQDQDAEFWQRLSSETLKTVWDNSEDDVYAELLAR